MAEAEKKFSVAALSAPDWPRLGALFHRVFGHPLEPRLADYKYAAGRGESTALVNDEGEVVAHCGMIFRKLFVAGVLAPGAQLGDLMVAPDARGVLSRRSSPFYRVVAAALQRLELATLKPVVFGFPSDRAMRVGERLGLFTEIDQISELIWPASTAPLQAIVQPVAGPEFSALVDRLWQKMAGDLTDAVVGVRDGAYFVGRYFNHPAHQYEVYVLRSRWLRLPLGVFALRRHGAMVELMDWVAPLDQGLAVIEQARRAAAGLGGERLMAWLTRAYAPRFAPGASSCQATEFRILVCGEVSAAWVERFKDHLWLTAGDTDYR